MLKNNPITGTLPTRTPQPTRRPRLRESLVRIMFGALLAAGLSLGVALKRDPVLLPEAVDLARAAFGPGAVASIESLAFQAQDSLRQARYQATGTATHTQWAAPPAPPPKIRQSPAQAGAGSMRPTPAARTGSGRLPTETTRVTWSPFVYNADGQPLLERALVSPDPTRPYVETALVRMDLNAVQLHLVAGTQEPLSSTRMARPGIIPAADRQPGRLLAAFNGGFKAANGAFGIYVNGVTLLPPIDGLATLAIYRDGRARIGVWGVDMNAKTDMIAYRQNCPLLLDGGRLTDQATGDDPTLWGATVKNKIATWRSGLGLSADGRYLLYAAGDGLTVPALAQALAWGGADRAMQLDINSFWARFVTFAPSGGRLVAQKLLADMAGDTRQFLAPDMRDFFYLTVR
jgi:Phosphodiester glycosidase